MSGAPLGFAAPCPVPGCCFATERCQEGGQGGRQPQDSAVWPRRTQPSAGEGAAGWRRASLAKLVATGEMTFQLFDLSLCPMPWRVLTAASRLDRGCFLRGHLAPRPSALCPVQRADVAERSTKLSPSHHLRCPTTQALGRGGKKEGKGTPTHLLNPHSTLRGTEAGGSVTFPSRTRQNMTGWTEWAV